MAQLQNGKKINSCNGPIGVLDLGYSLIHEHVIVKPNKEEKKYYPYILDDEDKALVDLQDLKRNGCSTIFDLTPINYGRDVRVLEKLAKASEVNIIAVTGFHKEEFLPEYVATKTINELTNIIVDEVENGIDGTNIKPALIKCGSSLNKITDKEMKCFKAVIKAHKKTGLPISTHTEKGTYALNQVSVFKKHGVNLKNVLLGHIDMAYDKVYFLQLLNTGVNVELDHIGRTKKHDDFVLDLIEIAMKEGCLDQVYLSQDMGKKDYLKSYDGGPGLDFMFKDFKTTFLKRFDEATFEKILVTNVRDFLTNNI